MLRRCATALLPLALLTACGGGDGSPGGGGEDEGLPKAEFVSQAEAICSRANAALEAEPQPMSPDAVAPYFDKLVGLADGATTDLEELAAEQPDKEEVDRIFLTPLRGQVDALEAYLPKAKEALAQGEEAFTNLPEPELPEADTAAMEDYGFDACVETARADQA